MVSKTIVWTDYVKTELQKVLRFYTERNGSATFSLKILKETEKLLKTLSKR
jgi:hypothetical protein